MTDFTIYFHEINYNFPMVYVKGTGDTTYLLGDEEKINIHVSDFFISRYQVTQWLWEYIMGDNPAYFKGPDRPVEHVSFHDITRSNGFLDKLNACNGNKMNAGNAILSFRLPSETEWEYAARGGVHWKDGFPFSGSNDLNAVGWYEQNSGPAGDIAALHQLKNSEKGTETHAAGQKSPNQLGIYDMSGNVWEWCQDYFQQDIHKIPTDGSPYLTESHGRVLRGGCHHNWAIHCTVYKRYEIMPGAADSCIGFRIAASIY